MDKKSQKAYEKAMKLYEEGNIDKSLNICESALSEELNNSDLLNFKGLLLYQQGKLNEAITVWKLNLELTNDKVAEKYIEDAQSDFERLNLYNEAEKALRNLNIDAALNMLLTCAVSDFNSVRVNTALASCYQKKGQYEKAGEYLSKALKVDKNYDQAIVLKKELSQFIKLNKKKPTSKKVLMTFTILFVVILLGGVAFALYMRINNESLFNGQDIIAAIKNEDNEQQQEEKTKAENKAEEDKENVEKKPEDNTQENKQEEVNKEETNVPEEEKKFDKDTIENLIQNNNVDGLCDALKGLDKNTISAEDMYLYRQATELINENGVAEYYNKGLDYYNQKNYESAETEFDKAYEFSENNSYRQHIMFYRASNLAKLTKTEEAIKQYEEYYSEYPDGVYSEGVLYELVLLYSSADEGKSKQYASDLVNNFPNSIYINDDVKNILNK